MGKIEDEKALAKTGLKFKLIAGSTTILCLTLALTGIGISLSNGWQQQDLLREVREDKSYIEYREKDMDEHLDEFNRDKDLEKYDAYSKKVDTDDYVTDYILKNDTPYAIAFEKVTTNKKTGDTLAITGLSTFALSMATLMIGFEKLDEKEKRLSQSESTEENEGE